jgi:hypothetical protein
MIDAAEYGEHIGLCRKILCPDCGEQVPTAYFIEHRNEHVKKMSRDLGVKLPEDDAVARRAIAGGVVDELTDFYETELNASREEIPVIAGVKVIPYEQDLLLGEFKTALNEPSLMPTGMTDPIDFALSNYVTIIWSDKQEFKGFIDKKPEYQTNRFPTGNYRRDYAMVKELTHVYGFPEQEKRAEPVAWRGGEETKEERIAELERMKEEEIGWHLKPNEPAKRKRKMLPESNKKAINKILGDLSTGSKYYEKIPLDDIFKAIRDNEGIPLQEDWTEWSGFLTGDDGRATIDIGNPDSKHQKDGLDFYTPYSNTMLVLTWHRMGTGRYEVIAYLS